MHPLLLFTLLFLPGIKSSHEDFINVGRNGGELAAISDTDVAPIEQPRTVDTTGLVKPEHDNGRLKPYESHVNKNYEKRRNNEFLALKDSREFLSSKGIKHEVNSKENHQYQISSHKHEDKQLHNKNKAKYYEEKKRYNMHDGIPEKKKFDEFKSLKKIKGHKGEKSQNYEREFIEKDKRLRKDVKKETSAKEKESYKLKREQYYKIKKAAEKYIKKHFNYDNEMKRLERIKRHAESSESEDEDYNEDDEDDSDENVSLGNAEKQIITHHFMDFKDDSRPYEDAVEVKLKGRNEDDELVPVVEDKITKTTAYISCGRNGGAGCGREDQDMGDHDYSIRVKTLAKEDEDQSDDEHIDMVTWLKVFEESIKNSGIRYNPT